MTKFNKILIFGTLAIIISVAVVFETDWVDLKIKKEVRQSVSSQNSSTFFLANIMPLRDWYAHRMSDNYILLTRQEKLPEIGATEGYAYGEQISINLMRIEISPEEWVAQKTYIDLDDVLVSSKEWSTYYGQKLLTVESEAGGALGKQYTQYIFTNEFIYVVSLYPFEIYDDASEKFVRNTEAVYDARRVLFRLLPQILAQESVQRQLAENCARDIPREKIDDTSFDSENKVVQTYWWDNEIGDNVSIIFPYEPETDFAGCSESVKELLRHIQETQSPMEQIKESVIIEPRSIVIVNFCGKDMQADSIVLNEVDLIKVIERIENEDSGLWLCDNKDNISYNFFEETLGVAVKEWRWDEKRYYIYEEEKDETNVYIAALYSKNDERQSSDPFNQSIFIYKFDFNINRIYTQSQFDGSFYEAGVIVFPPRKALGVIIDDERFSFIP